MSKILKSRHLFLEKEELVRWDKFQQEDGINDLIKNSIYKAGIVPLNTGILGSNFQFSIGSSFDKVVFANTSVAYDTQGNRIFYESQTGYEWTLPVTVGGVKETWIYIQYGTTHLEKGTVTLGINGDLIGTGTEFTKLFRGQASLVPNKIRIFKRDSVDTGGTGYSYTLQGTYEVVEVTDDDSMLLASYDALPAGTYVFSVVGAFSPGTFDDSREDEIYEYDFVDVVFSDTDPSGTLTADQFMLCKITIDDTGTPTQTIEDLRTDVFSLYKGEWVDITDDFNLDTTYFDLTKSNYIRVRLNKWGEAEISGELYLKAAAQNLIVTEIANTNILVDCDIRILHTKMTVQDEQAYTTAAAGIGFDKMVDLAIENSVSSASQLGLYFKFPDVLPTTIEPYNFYAVFHNKM